MVSQTLVSVFSSMRINATLNVYLDRAIPVVPASIPVKYIVRPFITGLLVEIYFELISAFVLLSYWWNLRKLMTCLKLGALASIFCRKAVEIDVNYRMYVSTLLQNGFCQGCRSRSYEIPWTWHQGQLNEQVEFLASRSLTSSASPWAGGVTWWLVWRVVTRPIDRSSIDGRMDQSIHSTTNGMVEWFDRRWPMPCHDRSIGLIKPLHFMIEK